MLLNIEGLTKRYDAEKVLDGINFTLDCGEIGCVLGPSGCGKTTLLKIIAGLEGPDAGLVENESRETAFIFQEARLLSWLSVRENVELVLNDNNDEGVTRRKVRDVLEGVKLADHADLYPDQLSGGMKQRVAIARALIVEPQLLLMDEPFSDLDFPLRLELIELLSRNFENDERGGLFVTHDIREALLICDRVVVMGDDTGKIKDEFEIGVPRAARDLRNRKLKRTRKHIKESIGPKLGRGHWKRKEGLFERESSPKSATIEE